MTGAKRKRKKQLMRHKVTETEVKAIPFVTIQILSIKYRQNLIKMPTKQSSKMLINKTLVSTTNVSTSKRMNGRNRKMTKSSAEQRQKMTSRRQKSSTVQIGLAIYQNRQKLDRLCWTRQSRFYPKRYFFLPI